MERFFKQQPGVENVSDCFKSDSRQSILHGNFI